MRAYHLIIALLVFSGVQTLTAAPLPLVPESWHEIIPSDAEGRARVFVSPDEEARLRIGHMTATGNKYRDLDWLMYREGETITYQRRGRSWLAVSGYRDGEIFYRKSNLACRGTRWHTIELQYPREAKERLDRIVTAIARNMGSYGSDCG